MTFRVNGQNTLITTTGDIGVGTLTPNGNVSIFSNSANAAIIISQAGPNGLALHVARGNVLITGNVQVQGTLNACTYIIPAITAAGNSAFDSPTLFVDAVGHKVGVGKTQPNVKMDIVGAMNASTEIYAGTKLRVGPNNFQMIDSGSNSRLEFNSTSGFIVLDRNTNVMYLDIAGAKVLEMGVNYVYSPFAMLSDSFFQAPESRLKRGSNTQLTRTTFVNERSNTLWRLAMGTQSSANTLTLDRFSEAGIYVDSPFSIDFTNGTVTVAGNTTIEQDGDLKTFKIDSRDQHMYRAFSTVNTQINFWDTNFAAINWRLGQRRASLANSFVLERLAGGNFLDLPLLISEQAAGNTVQFWDNAVSISKTGRITINGTNVSNTFPFILAASDQFSPILAGNNKVIMRMPFAYTATGVRASLSVAQVTGNTVNVDVTMNGNTVFSTKVIFDNNVKTSLLCNTQPVLSVTSWPDDAEIAVHIQSSGANTVASGLKVTLLGYPT